MKELYPLKFKPSFYEKIWGGKDIFDIYPAAKENTSNCGEAWLLSGLEGKESHVCNGYLEENNINELIEVYMGDLVGDAVFSKYGNEFPLLIKLINSADWLSVQVHPDDKIAKAKHNVPNGKTEMWYALKADKGAKLVCGFNKQTNKQTIEKLLFENTVRESLREIDVNQGDSFFIPAGLVHAIGPGLLIAEIQQSCDITYRLWDWNRTDSNGNSRELHINDALQSLNYSDDGEKIVSSANINSSSTIVECPQFTTNIINVEKDMKIEKDIFQIDSFIVYLCTSGKANIICDDSTVPINKGECILIPAVKNEIEIRSKEKCTMLETYIY